MLPLRCYSRASSASLLMRSVSYYRRICSAYLMPGGSHLSFWRDSAELNNNAPPHALGEYYMTFAEKAAYSGPFDGVGIPQLDYRGQIGIQYNPIAIAQWGLGNYNRFMREGSLDARNRFLRASEWLCDRLEKNSFGLYVWNHYFDWEYRQRLKAPWYSGLAQGQGISLLVRAQAETGDRKYLDCAAMAFAS